MQFENIFILQFNLEDFKIKIPDKNCHCVKHMINLILKLDSYDLLFLKKNSAIFSNNRVDTSCLFTEKMKTKDCSRKFVDDETSDSKKFSRIPIKNLPNLT